jgi:hypothetical protein
VRSRHNSSRQRGAEQGMDCSGPPPALIPCTPSQVIRPIATPGCPCQRSLSAPAGIAAIRRNDPDPPSYPQHIHSLERANRAGSTATCCARIHKPGEHQFTRFASSPIPALPAAPIVSASHGHGAVCARPGGELSGSVTRFTSVSCRPGYRFNSSHP